MRSKRCGLVLALEPRTEPSKGPSINYVEYLVLQRFKTPYLTRRFLQDTSVTFSLCCSWVLGDTVCKLYHFVHNLSYTASVFVLVVVGAERYLAVLHPMTCRAILRPARLKAAIAAVWLAAAALSASKLYWAQTVTVAIPGMFVVSVARPRLVAL